MNIQWDAGQYASQFQFVPQYGQDVLALLDIPAGAQVIDLGCGNGALTRKLADMGMGVTGIDASEEMLAIAGRQYPDLCFIKGDATDFQLEEKADAIFSNAVFHWIEDQDLLLQNVADQLKLQGQLVCEFGGKGCCETIHKAVEQVFAQRGLHYKRTFYFPTIGEYAPKMEQHGLQVVFAALFDRPTLLQGEDGMANWIRMFLKAPFQGIEASLAEHMTEEAVSLLKPVLYRDGKWYADYVRIRIKAIRK